PPIVIFPAVGNKFPSSVKLPLGPSRSRGHGRPRAPEETVSSFYSGSWRNKGDVFPSIAYHGR
ncbi:MAG: hypothetical protein II560_02630, partial [Bacteroidales bacterium]|nr:hypothetical protein [Bacteroidales bacterium]